MVSITKAVKDARKKVNMYRFGNQWQVDVWSESHRAWWQGNPTTYAKARALASEKIVEFALESLGYSEEDAWGLSSSLPCGSIPERIKFAIEKYPADKGVTRVQ